MADDSSNKQPIIKKVIKVEGGGHHGGAWKVAYADFTTAMMAFFMLLWLLNVAPPETLAGLADYFSPTTAAISGATGIREINPPNKDTRGLNPSPVVAIATPSNTTTAGGGEGEGEDDGAEFKDQFEAGNTLNDRLAERAKAQEDREFEQLQEQLQLAIQSSEVLAQHRDQLVLEITEEGLKIQLIDRDRRPMFRAGTADLFNFARLLLIEVSNSIQTLPNRIAVEGHTDGGSFRRPDGYSNWELSADRGNAARRVLVDSGLTNDRLAQVVGRASTDPLYPDAPDRPENRRITVLVLREAPVLPPSVSNQGF